MGIREGTDLYVAPWTILAGLGGLNRRELCNLLANFEATTLLAMSIDRATDILARFQNGGSDAETTAFARRLKGAAEALFTSQSSERALRIRLWARMAEALDFDLSLPLSTRSANSQGAGMAFKAAAITAMPIDDDAEDATETILQKVWRGVKSVRGQETKDFATLVADQAQLVARAVVEAARSGELSEQDQQAIDQRVRDHIESLPPELRDDAMRSALTAGDKAALVLLASGTSAFTVGVGVNLAGFSAYILAAQASAFIPLISGPAAVSTLFMLANPLFTVPAVVGIGYLANRHVNGGQAAKLAAVVTVQLALRGLTAERSGLAIALNNFRTATGDDFTALPATFRDGMLSRIAAIVRLMDGRLPEAPGDYTVSNSPDRFGTLLGGFLSRDRGDAIEVATVAGLTAGDMIYNAVSIDPMVLDAADFSRSEDIADVFQFGAFAERIGSMAVAAEAGAGNNLRGYVSEQLVAARLVEGGHVVTFPDTSNNPGFDLLVDGVPFQVKCLMSLDGLREHFSKYPDMPVYANGELAEAVIDSGAAWAGKVFYIDGFDRDIADLIMNTSLEAAEALGDLNVPYFAMAISSARNLHRVWRGRMPLSDLPFSVVVDGSVKGGLSAIGGLSGKALGLLAFGPAGALVLGGVGGVGALLGSGWTREQATRILSAEWLAELDVATEGFRLALISAIDAKIMLLEDKRSQTAAIEYLGRDWLVNRFSDDIVSLCEARYELQVDILTVRQPSKARVCIERMSRASVHPTAVQTQFVELLEVLKSEPSGTSVAGKKAGEAWNALRSKIKSRT